MQNGEFSGMTSFTMSVAGKFYKSNEESNWPRIISTYGDYTGVYEKINGIDYTVMWESDELGRKCSDGNADNCYTLWRNDAIRFDFGYWS